MLKHLNIKHFFRDLLPVSNNRIGFIYFNEFLFVQVLTLLIQGYHADEHHSVKQNDVINQLYQEGNRASQPTIPRFLKRLSQLFAETWNHALVTLATQFFTAQGYQQLVLDIDSPHFDTYVN